MESLESWLPRQLSRWNTLYAKVVDDRITLIENGVTLAENVVLTNHCAPGEPVCVRGRIELSGLAAPACFRNLYIGELPSTPVFELSPEEVRSHRKNEEGANR